MEHQSSCLKIISFLYLNKAKLLSVLNANISKCKELISADIKSG